METKLTPSTSLFFKLLDSYICLIVVKKSHKQKIASAKNSQKNVLRIGLESCQA